jgi:hypothetical protein
MRIVVATDKVVEIQAVRDAFTAKQIEAEVVGISAHFGGRQPPQAGRYPKQSSSADLIQSARDRIIQAKELDKCGDLYVGIKNERGGCFTRKPIVVCSSYNPRLLEQVSRSEGLEFWLNSSSVLTKTVSIALDALSEKILPELEKMSRGAEDWIGPPEEADEARGTRKYVADYRSYLEQSLLSADATKEIVGELDQIDDAGVTFYEDLNELMQVVPLAKNPHQQMALNPVVVQAEKLLAEIEVALSTVEQLISDMETFQEQYVDQQSQSPETTQVAKSSQPTRTNSPGQHEGAAVGPEKQTLVAAMNLARHRSVSQSSEGNVQGSLLCNRRGSA